MVEIEAILNSRPLTPLSNNAMDLSALTPGHFLIGEPLTSTVDPHAEPYKGSLIQRWKLVSHIKAEFWQRWTKEYLCELQHRYKWKSQCHNVKQGDMVIIKEDNSPVLSWPLGRVIEVIKGKDGLVRVVDVKTSAGVLRRPITRLAPLPIAQEEEKYTPPKIANDQEPHDDNPPAVKRRRRGISPVTSLLLLSCLVLPIFGAPQVKISPFNTSPGLYFEKLGAVQLTSSEWNLVVYYDLKLYRQEYDLILRGMSHLRYICSLMTDTVVCNDSIGQFNNLIAHINNSEPLLRPTPMRIKRAPLDIIGNIAGSLFGVLDSKYAMKMAKTIEELDTNDNQLYNLLKNQTSIIDSTVNIIQQTQKITTDHFQELDQRINDTIKFVTGVHHEFANQRSLVTFNTISVKLATIMSNFLRMQAVLLDVLTASHHGKVSPQLLTPEQLQQQIKIIKEHLPHQLQVPADEHNLLGLYSIMKIEGRVISDRIIFRIRLPLFTDEPFELLHVVPIPIFINNSAVIIHPETEFLIINLQRDQYYPLSNQEMNRCSSMGNSLHVCTQHHPMHRKGSAVARCEMNLLLQSTQNPECTVIRHTRTSPWIQLLQANTWIYAFNTTSLLRITCDLDATQQQISGSGILSMDEGCSVRDDTATLKARTIYSTVVRSAIIPSQNFTHWIHPIDLHLLSYNAHSLHDVSSNITKLKEEVQRLREKELIIKPINHHDIHQYSIGYLGLCLIIILIIVITGRHIYHKRKNPIPIPPIRSSSLAFEIPKV